jgi:hypothetical protein
VRFQRPTTSRSIGRPSSSSDENFGDSYQSFTTYVSYFGQFDGTSLSAYGNPGDV